MDSWLVEVEGKRPLLRKEGLTNNNNNNNNNNGMVGHGGRKIHWIAGTATVAMCDKRIRADAPAFRGIISKFEPIRESMAVMIADIKM